MNWKGYRDTIECLESLTRMEGGPFRVIVVDNESNPDGVAQIAAWAGGDTAADRSGPPWRGLKETRITDSRFRFLAVGEAFEASSAPFVTVILNAENSGFAGGCNIGIRAALTDPECDFVWLLNNDTVVDTHALTELTSVARADPAIGICGSTLVYYDEPEIVQTIGGRYNIYLGKVTNLFEGARLSDLRKSSPAPQFDYVCGASMLLSRAFLETVGLLSEEYFVYFEELDLVARNNRRFSLAWAENSVVYHKEGRSIGTNSRGRPSNTTLYYYNVNFLRFIRKFHPWLLPLTFLKVSAVAANLRLRRDAAGFRVVKKAVVDFVTGGRQRGRIE